jgi:acyl-CoA thioester hydrolase
MTTKDSYQYQLKMAVRDYECDMQSIVNNAIYQNYMEHTRHEFIKTIGLDFNVMCEQGIDVVVARIEIAFKNSLRSGDHFVSCVNVHKEGIKYIFDQAIFHAATGQIITTGKVTTVARVNGKLSPAPFSDKALEKL